MSLSSSSHLVTSQATSNLSRSNISINKSPSGTPDNGVLANNNNNSNLPEKSNGEFRLEEGAEKLPEEKKGKSRKFLNQWKQAASMSKLGNRTKNLLEKWKSTSYSVDLQDQGSVSEHALADKMTEGSGVKEILKVKDVTAKTKWSEHIWSAWVHRGFSDDVTEVTTVQPGGDLLTDFQKDKFRYFFFHVLDLNSDNVISSEDFQKLNERIRHYMDWSVNTVQYLVLKEVHETFLENFLAIASNFSKKPDDGFDYWDPFKNLDAVYKQKREAASSFDDAIVDEIEEQDSKTCVTIEEWIDVWGILVGRAKTLADFPMWLQCYPKVLFEIINRTGTGIISKSELKHFYTAFMDVGKLGEERLDEFTNNAFNALTCDGDINLTYQIYKLSFLNFLLGKQPNGPGQYIFGTVKPCIPICSFPIDYSAMNATEEDMEIFGHEKLEKTSRRSVIV